MDLATLLNKYEQDILDLRSSLTKTVAALRKDMDFSRRELHHLAEILVDDALLFRFYKKHKFNQQAAQEALLAHIDWRLQNDLPNLSINSLTPKSQQYLHQGFFYFIRPDVDGRPVAMLNLNIYKGGDIEDLRDHLVFQMDVARRIVMSINEERRRKGEDLIVQISVIVDLAGAGLSSMSYEVIPLFHDLFSRHFPQTIHTVYVLNYSWLHAGIWSVIKTTLPASATKKLQFLTAEQLQEHIPPDNLPQSHGGTDPIPFSASTSPIYTTFAHPNYHFTSRRVHDQIAALDAEDEGYHEDEDIWYDALEVPMTPCRSAADLQSMLRVASGRNLHGMNRISSTKSLKGLASNYALHPSRSGSGGLMMRPVQQQPVTVVNAKPSTKGRRRALVKRTFAKAVSTPATSFISLVSSIKSRKRYITTVVLLVVLVYRWRSEIGSGQVLRRLYWDLMARRADFSTGRKRDVGIVESPMVVAAVGGALGN